MQGIENKLMVLKLNKNWQVVDTATVADALIDLAAGKNSIALDITYPIDDNGNFLFKEIPNIRMVKWDEWITLPVREYDFSISTVKMEIRVPTILVAKNYAKVPKVKFGNLPNAEQIRIRDGNTCQYTGRKLRKDEISIDHVIPRSRGGKNTWENQVVTSKELNAMKGNKLNEELGFKLIRPPTRPKEILRSQLIREARHRDWMLFLENVDN